MLRNRHVQYTNMSMSTCAIYSPSSAETPTMIVNAGVRTSQRSTSSRKRDGRLGHGGGTLRSRARTGEVRLVFLPSDPSPGKHWPVFSAYRLPPHNRFKSATLLTLSNVRRAACEDVVRWCGCVCGWETEYRVRSSSKSLQQP